MRKQIDFPPYKEADIKSMIKAVDIDGNVSESVVCDLYGDEHNDKDISFPINSSLLNLTLEEIELITGGK